ncbi:DUF11 domain-containing protein [Geomonas sp. Red69]|uniref:DUF7933 domain-containing protein n=1 Tax=Geomonas diazotrophica TaxID=2843197 RepID=UPI001C10CF5D|nr:MULTISPECIES: DUF11 domain-containing protein [Geomonas]MBU5635296.1 DUF11 domain-containing protein [Geomonas diazotrophica]QXE86787.1 DUF11 domain-containing protein [Geomonas nitrogeniifigens]
MHKVDNPKTVTKGNGRRRHWHFPGIVAGALLALLGTSSASLALTTSAWKDQTCVGYRTGGLNCTAGEFTIAPVFTAQADTPPFCIAGGAFSFKVELGLSGTNTDRYDVGFFVGQQGNDPRDTTPGNICSVAAFPTSPSPWLNLDGDGCGDFKGGANFTTTVDEIKVLCTGDNSGALKIPYVVTYWQNPGNACTGPGDVSNGSPSKCNAGVATVAGNVSVFTGAFVDVTKQTLPDGSTQPFSFTATGPAGSKVVVLTGATLTATSASGGTYSPSTIAAAGNSVSFTLKDNETARVFINALATDQTLTITEGAAGGDWDNTAAIACAPVTGSPTFTTTPAARSLSAALNTTNSAGACTITNTKRPRVTLVKNVAARINAGDQFTVSASGGGTLTGTTTVSTSGTQTSASTVFNSSPGIALTLNDTKAAGSTAATRYAGSLTCSNAYTGSGATPAAALPNQLFTSSYSLTPVAGDELTCTFTNTPRPALSKSYTSGSIALGGSSTLNFNIVNEPTTKPAQRNLAFTDTFPAGLTVTGVAPLTGTGCSGTPSFTTSAVSLSAGAMTAGTANCNFSATVRGDAAASYLNNASRFSGEGGGLDTSSASATLNVFTPPTVAKSFGAATVAMGAPVSLSLILTNPAANAAPLTGVSVTDTFPAGMVLRNTGFSFTPAGCGSVTNSSGAASAAGDNGVRFSSSSIAPGASCQVTLNVASSGYGTLTNTTTAPLAAGPVSLAGSSASADLNVAAMPLISILKSANRSSADPGQDVLYTIEVANTGGGAGSNVVLTDDLSPYVSFYLGGGTPFTFTDGAPASGVSLGVPQYSSDKGATWGYAPAPGAGGAPAGYDGNITTWRIPMSGTIRAGGNFRLDYKVRVK